MKRSISAKDPIWYAILYSLGFLCVLYDLIFRLYYGTYHRGQLEKTCFIVGLFIVFLYLFREMYKRYRK